MILLFTGKFETLQSDINYLSSMKFPMYQNQIQSVFDDHKLNKNENKSEKTSSSYFQQLSKELVLKLYSVFQDDFHVGEYDYPQMYLDAAQN